VRHVYYASGAAAADARCRVRRGVAARHPAKYVLDEGELARVSKLARIELEDARAELQRAHEAAAGMGKDPVVDDDEGEGDEDAWVE
jgi:periodic tryptophan protein 1